MTAPGALEVRLLGRFVVVRDGREIAAADFGGRKVRALLRILAIAGDQGWRLRNPDALDRAREVAAKGQRAAILSRAAAQDPQARDVLDLLAVVGREVPARVLALAIGTAESGVPGWLEALSRAVPRNGAVRRDRPRCGPAGRAH